MRTKVSPLTIRVGPEDARTRLFASAYAARKALFRAVRAPGCTGPAGAGIVWAWAPAANVIDTQTARISSRQGMIDYRNFLTPAFAGGFETDASPHDRRESKPRQIGADGSLDCLAHAHAIEVVTELLTAIEADHVRACPQSSGLDVRRDRPAQAAMTATKDQIENGIDQ